MTVFVSIADLIAGRLAVACDDLRYGSPSPSPEGPARTIWAELGDSRRADPEWIGLDSWTTDVRLSIEARAADGKARSALLAADAMFSQVIDLLEVRPETDPDWLQALNALGVSALHRAALQPAFISREAIAAASPIATISIVISVPHVTEQHSLAIAAPPSNTSY